MSTRQPDAATFLKDVANHQMKVLHHDGIYRHLIFRQPGDNSWNMWFDLVTWPGNLVIRGDMGTWTFSRLDDMFAFFRSTGELKINDSYWAEKLQNGTSGGRKNAKEFSVETFAEELTAHAEGHFDENDSNRTALVQAVKDEILIYDTKFELFEAVHDFEWKYRIDDDQSERYGDHVFKFDTSDLPDGETYGYHFIWCLYAIVWGIQQWDATVEASKVAA